jgi:hypothetical protein
MTKRLKVHIAAKSETVNRRQAAAREFVRTLRVSPPCLALCVCVCVCVCACVLAFANVCHWALASGNLRSALKSNHSILSLSLHPFFPPSPALLISGHEAWWGAPTTQIVTVQAHFILPTVTPRRCCNPQRLNQRPTVLGTPARPGCSHRRGGRVEARGAAVGWETCAV